jgi:putative oxidoreductase
MKRLIFNQQAIWDNSLCLLRIWCGVIFIRYGLSILHVSSVEDFGNTLQTVNIPFPLLSPYLCKSTEFLGGIFLVLGFLKKPACIFLIADMTVATFVFHKGLLLQNGMTTFTLLISCLTILLTATDKFCLDRLIANHLFKVKEKKTN